MFINESIICLSIFASLCFCIYFIRQTLMYPSGNNLMVNISNTIESCAKIYLWRQYKTIFFISIILSLLILLFFGKYFVIGFLIGAFFSALTGYIGMLISVKANVRTANAARIGSLSDALIIAFRAGSVTGLLVVSFSILGIFLYYIFLKTMLTDNRLILNSLLSLGLGASLISIFARLGGGIFTKGADIGADLVGKLEIGIPEDDFRNPAVIADNVGDNVGDCAGMAADLYETVCVTIIASMFLIGILCDDYSKYDLMMYPLMLGSLSIFSMLIGIFFVNLDKNKVMAALYKGFFASSLIFILFLFLFVNFFLGWNSIYSFSNHSLFGKQFFYCSLIGIFLTVALVLITEYYTSTKYFPVKDIARVSNKGHATNIIQGLAFSMESTALPVLSVIISIIVSYSIGGIIGVTIAATSMISLSGIIVALDAYGPITDNAGGIAEMSKLNKDVRIKTDILDSVGNTTKAITKGYAIGSAGLGSLVLFIAYTEDLKFYFSDINFSFSLTDPFVIIGLFFGGIIPYLFASFSMRSVGNVASKVVDEVRLQFSKTNTTQKPDYEKVVDILTKEAIKEMILPSTFPILLPIIFYYFIFLFFDKHNAFIALGSVQLGVIITGIFLAISMTSGGGAWDNAKKYIEEGNFGGKKSFAYKAAITGDMVGDPYKDTSGPAINPLIKISNIVALFLVILMSKI